MPKKFQVSEIERILVVELAKYGVSVKGSSADTLLAPKKSFDTSGYRENVEIKLAPNEIIPLLNNYLTEGKSSTSSTAGGKVFSFSRMLGSGFLKMNPTLLIVIVRENSNNLDVIAHAKEGFINQHSARKAVDSFIKSLHDLILEYQYKTQ